MKKIVMGLAAVAMAGSMFAANPAFAPSMAEYSGNQSVTWGIDLDNDNKTGFKNEGSATLKFNLFTAGDKTTSGDSDVWAELKIKNDSNDTTGAMSVPGATVDVAKFHIYNMYVGIKSGDTQTGELKVTRAIKSGDNDNGKVLVNVGPAGYSQGIVAGYADDNFGVDVDFRSKPAGTNVYTNDYALAAEVTLKEALLFGAEVKGGVSYEFADAPVMGYSGSVAYKVDVADGYYVKAAAGYAGEKLDGTTTSSDIAAAVIFGWGDTADDNAGVYYLNTDAEKKVTPGVSVSYVKDLENDDDLGSYEVAFFSGSLVENLKAAALAEIGIANIPVFDETTMGMIVRAGAKYDIKADKITITPKAGFKWTKEVEVKDVVIIPTALEVSAGVDVAGLINDTVFSVEYVSGDLKAEPEAKKGTLNFKAKISL